MCKPTLTENKNSQATIPLCKFILFPENSSIHEQFERETGIVFGGRYKQEEVLNCPSPDNHTAILQATYMPQLVGS